MLKDRNDKITPPAFTFQDCMTLGNEIQYPISKSKKFSPVLPLLKKNRRRKGYV